MLLTASDSFNFINLYSDEKNENDKLDLMQELNTLKKVGCHENIVCLVGACFQGMSCDFFFFFSKNAPMIPHVRDDRSSHFTDLNGRCISSEASNFKILK